MISTLHIKNIGIIDDLNINLNQGLNVFTGETGAGKTLIIGSLAILAGARFSKDMIRRGEEYSFVELCFYLPEHNQNIDGNVIISREIYSNGRNLCKINGRMVTVNELRNFMKELIDIHGQNENQTLLEIENHIKLLDLFAESEILNIKKEYKVWYEKLKQVKNCLKENYGDEKEKQRKLDLLEYQSKEIEDAKLKTGEEEELNEKRNIILNSEKIVENLNIASKNISDIAIDAVSTAIKAIEKIENLDANYTNNLNILKSVYYELQESGRDINDMFDNISFDEEEQKQIEERLDIITSLKRKYGNNIQEILNYLTEINIEIERIRNIEQYNNKLKKEQKQIEEKMTELSIKMHEIRKKYGSEISDKINSELSDLEMPNAKFYVNIEIQDFGENGYDKVEFLITTNKGEQAKPLVKIASGGEISRIMLAIKTVLADVDNVPVLVFDEIDTGISGIAAESVAKKLKAISKNHQIICVTHLANIAASGDYNYYISKEVINEKTKTKVEILNEENVLKEIARIASGAVTQIAIQHATELRQKVKI